MYISKRYAIQYELLDQIVNCLLICLSISFLTRNSPLWILAGVVFP